MATVFKIGEDWEMPPPPPGFPKCGNYNGKELVSYLYPEDIESQHTNVNGFNNSFLDAGNDTRINMISTLGKWLPFVGGAHPYVSSIANTNTPFFLFILICLLLIK